MSPLGFADRREPVHRLVVNGLTFVTALVTLAGLVVAGTMAYVIWFRADSVVTAGKVLETYNGDGSYLVEFTTPDGEREVAAVVKPAVPQRRPGDHVQVSYVPPLEDIVKDDQETTVANSPLLISWPVLAILLGSGGFHYVRRLSKWPGRERLEVS
jgi:hypothetical protein